MQIPSHKNNVSIIKAEATAHPKASMTNSRSFNSLWCFVALLCGIVHRPAWGAVDALEHEEHEFSSIHEEFLFLERVLSKVDAHSLDDVHHPSNEGGGKMLSLTPPSMKRFTGRSLQDFATVCTAFADALTTNSKGALQCSCFPSQYKLTCYTPKALCPMNQTHTVVESSVGEDDSVNKNLTRVEDPNKPTYCSFANFTSIFQADLASGPGFGEWCSSFADVAQPTGPYREGCIRTKYGKDGGISSCQGVFANDQGTVQVCQACRPCDSGGSDDRNDGVALDCSNILPNATSTKCYIAKGSNIPEGSRFLFPTGGNGTLTIGDPNGIPYNQDNTSGTAPMAGGSIQMMLVGVITAFIVLVGL